jgi:hypothetical protein
MAGCEDQRGCRLGHVLFEMRESGFREQERDDEVEGRWSEDGCARDFLDWFCAHRGGADGCVDDVVEQNLLASVTTGRHFGEQFLQADFGVIGAKIADVALDLTFDMVWKGVFQTFNGVGDAFWVRGCEAIRAAPWAMLSRATAKPMPLEPPITRID